MIHQSATLSHEWTMNGIENVTTETSSNVIGLLSAGACSFLYCQLSSINYLTKDIPTLGTTNDVTFDAQMS